MVLTIENAGELIPGNNSNKEVAMQTKKVKVLRAFYFQGKEIKVGEVTELPRVFALEMIAANKCTAVEEEKKPEKPTVDEKPKVPAPDSGKGGKHVK